jgi:hypothetical protein
MNELLHQPFVENLPKSGIQKSASSPKLSIFNKTRKQEKDVNEENDLEI